MGNAHGFMFERRLGMKPALAVIKKGDARAFKAGGLWIYDNEIDYFEGDFNDGDVIEVHDFDGYPLGKGVVNRNSKITVRMLTKNINQEIDDEFIFNRVKNAYEYRKRVTDMSSCRLIFGEADYLPGLVIDKYSDVLVVESLSLGMDRFKLKIIDDLKKLLASDGVTITGVYERSDAYVRETEGM